MIKEIIMEFFVQKIRIQILKRIMRLKPDHVDPKYKEIKPLFSFILILFFSKAWIRIRNLILDPDDPHHSVGPEMKEGLKLHNKRNYHVILCPKNPRNGSAS